MDVLRDYDREHDRITEDACIEGAANRRTEARVADANAQDHRLRRGDSSEEGSKLVTQENEEYEARHRQEAKPEPPPITSADQIAHTIAIALAGLSVAAPQHAGSVPY